MWRLKRRSNRWRKTALRSTCGTHAPRPPRFSIRRNWNTRLFPTPILRCDSPQTTPMEPMLISEESKISGCSLTIRNNPSKCISKQYFHCLNSNNKSICVLIYLYVHTYTHTYMYISWNHLVLVAKIILI